MLAEVLNESVPREDDVFSKEASLSPVPGAAGTSSKCGGSEIWIRILIYKERVGFTPCLFLPLYFCFLPSLSLPPLLSSFFCLSLTISSSLSFPLSFNYMFLYYAFKNIPVQYTLYPFRLPVFSKGLIPNISYILYVQEVVTRPKILSRTILSN